MFRSVVGFALGCSASLATTLVALASTLLAALVLLGRPASAQAPLSIPWGSPLPKLPILRVDQYSQIDIRAYGRDIKIRDPAGGATPLVKYRAPLLQFSYKGTAIREGMVGPLLQLAPSFSLRLRNDLPAQLPCKCGCTVNGDTAYCEPCELASVPSEPDNPLGIFDFFHDSMYTNLHTHGLKVDVGASSLGAPDPCARPAADECNPAALNQPLLCGVWGDNIFTGVPSGGTTAVNHYTLPPHMPGLSWVHHHFHGSVALLTATGHAPMIVPDMPPSLLFAPSAQATQAKGPIKSWRDWRSDGGNRDPWLLHQAWSYPALSWGSNDVPPSGKPADRGCQTFQRVLQELPNFSPDVDVLAFQGLWFRNTVNGDPDDDSLMFTACSSYPPSPLVCPNGTLPDGSFSSPINYSNQQGKDAVAINDVMQPTIRLYAGRYQRWLMLGTITQKWLDLTIHPAPAAGSGVLPPPAAGCTMYLLAKDGVYLPRLPRLLSSRNDARAPGVTFNNLILSPGARADVLVTCSTPGRYVLVSGAGPFDTKPDCTAVHCELFGGSVNKPDAIKTTLNHRYEGADYGAAILATINVLSSAQCTSDATAVYNSCVASRSKKCTRRSCAPQPALVHEACQTRYELFEYLDVPSYPAATSSQCVGLFNEAGGAVCSVNGFMFSAGKATCMTQGTRQQWQLRDISFHPFHLHETPVQTTSLPSCVTGTPGGPFATNNWGLGEWQDVEYFPTCTCAGAGCDAMGVAFKATRFPAPPAGGSTVAGPSRAEILRYRNQISTSITTAPCVDRYSVYHCHILNHEDEGCMSLLFWKCPDAGAGACPFNSVCPAVVAPMAEMGRHHSNGRKQL